MEIIITALIKDLPTGFGKTETPLNHKWIDSVENHRPVLLKYIWKRAKRDGDL
jgi:hypothetical protein